MEKINGVIDRLVSGKKSGFIKKNGSEEEFYFLATQLVNTDYKTLEKGANVSFVSGALSSKGGHRFANNIEVLETTKQQTVENKTQPKPEIQLTQSVMIRMIEELTGIFNKTKNLTNPDEFEDAVFVLLRCLGIHRLYQFDRKSQAGQADGFFIVENLAVMYDCTLRDGFEDHKREQIENYANKLNNKSQLTVNIKRADGGSKSKVLQISGKTKQVWIISKGSTREINDYDDTKVKEVCVDDLVKVLTARLYTDIFEEVDLSTRLTLIDRT